MPHDCVMDTAAEKPSEPQNVTGSVRICTVSVSSDRLLSQSFSPHVSNSRPVGQMRPSTVFLWPARASKMFMSYNELL